MTASVRLSSEITFQRKNAANPGARGVGNKTG